MAQLAEHRGHHVVPQPFEHSPQDRLAVPRVQSLVVGDHLFDHRLQRQAGKRKEAGTGRREHDGGAAEAARVEEHDRAFLSRHNQLVESRRPGERRETLLCADLGEHGLQLLRQLVAIPSDGERRGLLVELGSDGCEAMREIRTLACQLGRVVPDRQGVAEPDATSQLQQTQRTSGALTGGPGLSEAQCDGVGREVGEPAEHVPVVTPLHCTWQQLRHEEDRTFQDGRRPARVVVAEQVPGLAGGAHPDRRQHGLVGQHRHLRLDRSRSVAVTAERAVQSKAESVQRGRIAPVVGVGQAHRRARALDGFVEDFLFLREVEQRVQRVRQAGH